MSRTVRLVCARCGHPEMVVVESPENNEEAVAEIVRTSGAPVTAADETQVRLRRLKSLPKSLPVGGIITPI